ncbi:MAG: hypothetical protein AAF004_10055 [Pseudomonadota bacterium]
MKLLHRAMLVLAMLSISSIAVAQQGKIELKTVVEVEERTVNEAGEAVVKLVPADKVVPGDVVVYTVTYTNVADQAVEKVVITNPIADGLDYVADSAFAPGAAVSFSVDGGTEFAALDTLTVEREGELVAASIADLTHIRWTLEGELDPGSQGFARFRARLN